MTWDISGKVVVITGASDGIGAAAARELHRRGAEVVPVGRSPEKTRAIAAELGVEPLVADFASLAEVRRLAADLLARCPRIDVLANNAGGTWPKRQLTVDGHELTFQANHLAMFLLTELLRERLVQSAPARVIVTSSSAHRAGRLADLDDLDREKGYKVNRVYGTSKLLNILYTRQLATSFAGTGVTAYSFHPGSVATKFGRDQALVRFAYQGPIRVFFKTPEQGADTLVYLATAPTEELANGGFYFKRKLWTMSADAKDEAAPARLWAMSEELVGLARA